MRGGWWHNKWRETVKCLMLCIPHWFPWQWPLLNMLLPSLLSGTFPIATRHTATQGFSALKIEVGGISQQRNPCLANITVDWFVEVTLNHSEPHAWWITKHCSVTLYCVFTILRLSKQATMVHCSWQFAGNTDFFFFFPPPLFLTAKNNILISGLEERSMWLVHGGLSNSHRNVVPLNIRELSLQQKTDSISARDLRGSNTFKAIWERRKVKWSRAEQRDLLMVICQI